MKFSNKKTVLFIFSVCVLVIILLYKLYSTKSTYRLTEPISVYVTWGAHDNLSDTIPLSEKLVFKQLKAIHTLKKTGSTFDYFVLDAGWADTLRRCRKFNSKYWPNGPKKWISACKKEHILPGLWFPINLTGLGKTTWMSMHPSWNSSKVNNQTLSLSEGKFLNDHIQTFQYWYNQGIRLFKLDFALFNVATKGQKDLESTEIIKLNEDALYQALYAFKQKNKDAIFLAYNGFGGEMKDTYPTFTKTIQNKWLEIFESLYSGDPRPSDIPCSNFWRSKDIYSDHMVRQFQFNGIPLSRIDNSSFMIGNTGTCYQRKKAAWKSTFLLSLARGGWVNTIYGDLSLLNSSEMKWFSKAQTFWYTLQKNATFQTVGSIPGIGNSYGYTATTSRGKIITLVNPSQTIQKITLPIGIKKHKILYFDGGDSPRFREGILRLLPEQLVILGTEQFASKDYSLGQSNEMNTSNQTKLIYSVGSKNLRNQLSFKYFPKTAKKLKIIFQLTDQQRRPIRLSGGAPPNGTFLNEIFQVDVLQKNRKVDYQTNSTKQIWSGMSWVIAEINENSYTKNIPMTISLKIPEKFGVKGTISCTLYEVN